MLLALLASVVSSPLVHAPLLFLIFRVAATLGTHRVLYNCLSVIPIIWFFLCSMTYPSIELIKYLESPHPTVNIESEQWKSADAIVVLACNYYEEENFPYVSRWPNCSLQRNLQAVLMYKTYPLPIYLAGDVLNRTDSESQAEHNKSFFEYFGVPTQSIHTISKGTNTETEVAAIASILNGNKVALVTSASHLTRAIKYFDAFDIETIAIPVEHLSRRHTSFTIGLPSAKNLYRSERAIHEYLGLIYQDYFL